MTQTATPEAGGSVRRNRLVHILSLSATKLADGLIDPKLVLSWLLSTLGAPPAAIGLLVPVREAGALLPQLFLSGAIRAMRAARLAWAAGSAAQGLAAGAIAVAAVTLSGAAAGAAVVAALALLAVARSVCSASYKHVLGLTVPKSERGGTTGLAGSLSAAGVLAFAAVLTFGPGASIGLVAAAIALAALLWLAAAAIFTTLDEPPTPDRDPGPPGESVRRNLGLLRRDAGLRRFVLTRGLLIATALAPPFVVTLGAASLDRLGWMVAASALAGLLSSWVWGRFSDRSARLVLAAAGGLGALALAGAAAAGPAAPGALIAALLFLLMIAHHGVRLGRSTQLVDMGTEATRAGYTALSNTVIGVLLLAGGLYGVVAALAGTPALLWLMAAQAALGGASALRLPRAEG